MELTRLYNVTYEVNDETHTDTFTGLQLWVWQDRIDKGTANEKIIKTEEAQTMDKVVEMKRVDLTTYGTYVEASDTQQQRFFSVPFEWLENFVIEQFDVSVSEFLDEYTWDWTEIVLREAKTAGVVEYPEEVCYEWCPHCEGEVQLAYKFEVQICPSCGQYILPCNVCTRDRFDCTSCPLEEQKKALQLKEDAE